MGSQPSSSLSRIMAFGSFGEELLFAVAHKNIPLLQHLLAKSEQMLPTIHRSLALVRACELNDTEMVGVLLQGGADATQWHSLALQIASLHNNEHMCVLLWENSVPDVALQHLQDKQINDPKQWPAEAHLLLAQHLHATRMHGILLHEVDGGGFCGVRKKI